MTPDRLTADALIDRLATLPSGQRTVVAVAGPPASGKSTLAERAVTALNKSTPGRAALLAMDGYHYDDGLLDVRGLRARKGAPDTFDVGGLASILHRIRANAEHEIAVPVFDRSIEIARAGAAMIPRTAEVIVAEGNYLLLGTPPWVALAPLFDLKVLIDVSEEELRRRLEERWRGFRFPEDEVTRRVEANDLPNGRQVLRDSVGADVVVIPG